MFQGYLTFKDLTHPLDQTAYFQVSEPVPLLHPPFILPRPCPCWKSGQASGGPSNSIVAAAPAPEPACVSMEISYGWQRWTPSDNKAHTTIDTQDTPSTDSGTYRRSAFGLHFKCLRPQLLYWLFDCPEERQQWRRWWWPWVWDVGFGRGNGNGNGIGLCNQGGESMYSESLHTARLARAGYPLVLLLHILSAL